jgi:putative DNA primase/helicase
MADDVERGREAAARWAASQAAETVPPDNGEQPAEFDPLDEPHHDDEPPPDPENEPAETNGLALDGYEPIPGFPSDHYGQDERYDAPSAPADVARFLCGRDFHIWPTGDNQQPLGDDTGRGPKTLAQWHGSWMTWRTTHWAELDTIQLRAHIYRTLSNANYLAPTKDGEFEDRAWKPDKNKVANIIDAMQAFLHLPSETEPPTSIHRDFIVDGELISFTNGLLNLKTRQLGQHTPALFNIVSVPFDYQENPDEPKTWLTLLNQVWGEDRDSILLLQEYFGYLLSGRTHMQKMLLLIGPTRSGKGTIGRLLRKLLGAGNITAPTLASLGTNFGLAPLLNKPLAIVSDARLGRDTNLVVERLLSITGEDTITVDRKYRDSWTGKLPTRFVILTNEIPRFHDASGAIANRMVILHMTESFLGREDRELDAKLAQELPAIMLWALEGLDRLNRNKHFTIPDSSNDAVTMMMDLASPVSAFVRECCQQQPTAEILTENLYSAWKNWAETNGHHSGAHSTFGRDLRAVVPAVKIINPRINNVPVRKYAGITLNTADLNGQNNPNGSHPRPQQPAQRDPGEPLHQHLACECGNPLLTPESARVGVCKPCRDKKYAGYDR